MTAWKLNSCADGTKNEKLFKSGLSSEVFFFFSFGYGLVSFPLGFTVRRMSGK